MYSPFIHSNLVISKTAGAICTSSIINSAIKSFKFKISSPSGKEILNLKDLIAEFMIEDVHIAPAVFDITKLEWMNGEYIRKMSDEELTTRLQEFLVDHPNMDKIAPAVPLIKDRI